MFGVLGLAALVLNGCTGSGAGLDANGNPISSSSGPESLTASFQSIQDNVFTPICTKCHAGAGAPEGLQLDAAHSYDLLVGIPSAEQPAVLRVDPGHPDDSYLVRKLEGAAGITGVRMPFGGPYLPQATIDVIRQWILAGSTRSPAASSGLPQAMAAQSSSAHPTTDATQARAPAAAHPLRQAFVVTGSAPEREAISSIAVPRIIVGFSGEIDTSLLNETTVSLQKLAAGRSPGATSLPVLLSVPKGNPAALLITPRSPLQDGTYRLTLRGSGAAALADVDAHTLGTDYSITFTVDVIR